MGGVSPALADSSPVAASNTVGSTFNPGACLHKPGWTNLYTAKGNVRYRAYAQKPHYVPDGGKACPYLIWYRV